METQFESLILQKPPTCCQIGSNPTNAINPNTF
jgi:hypothetical protein